MAEIVAVGWPRSGTHLLVRLLERATGHPVGHSHDLDVATVLTVRDPRDAFLSHWELYNHDHRGVERSQAEHFDKFFCGYGMRQPYFALGWRAYMEQWLASRCPKTRHEDIKIDPVGEVTRLVGQLGFRLKNVPVIVERCDPSGLPATGEMGRVGRWHGNIDADVLASLEDYCRPIMRQLGYVLSNE